MRTDFVERVVRAAYSAALYLLVPVTVYHLIWRGFRQREYFQRWSERYAHYAEARRHAPLWVHAVSVGEVNAAVPLVDALLRTRPDQRMVVTTITPTGSARVRALWGDRVDHVYLPYDLSGAIGRFLDHFSPRIALVMETELWPNLLFTCRDRGIPAYIVNARLSARSLRGYRVLAPLIGRALATVRRVCAQGRADGERFVRLGAPRERIAVTGNLKYDVADPDGLEQLVIQFRHYAGTRPTWIAASTHPDEEAAVVAAHRRLRARWPDALLVWAPRHPERFKPVAEFARSNGLRVARRSSDRWPAPEDAVFLLDTLGELGRFYAVADVAFVGGSLQPIGGHNLLEPAAVGTPIITGLHLHNFTEIAAQLGATGALVQSADAEALADDLDALMGDPARRRAMAEAGRLLVEEGRGALQRTLDAIAADLPSAA